MTNSPLWHSYEIKINAHEKSFYLNRLLYWANTFSCCCLLNSNDSKDEYSKHEYLLAVGVEKSLSSNKDSLKKLERFQKSCTNSIFGFISYDLNTEYKDIIFPYSTNSKLHKKAKFPHIYFFLPTYIVHIQTNTLIMEGEESSIKLAELFQFIFKPGRAKQSLKNESKPFQFAKLNSRETKSSYLAKVKEIQQHIKLGNLYELNFCQEFFIENFKTNPLELYNLLNAISPSPFSAFLKYEDCFIISSSPERFLQRSGTKLLSQPMKGTSTRGKQGEEDTFLAYTLENDPKEIAENTMIVDLVRNDLGKIALTGTVRVEEYCKVKSFAQVHQLVSSVSAEVHPEQKLSEILNALFPMGSMTGAPKIKAMELIAYYETIPRSVFSGSIGYIQQNGDFDFNVLIRTILYNSLDSYLSFSTGSAITSLSIPEKEYQECLLKTQALLDVLGY